MKLQRVATMVMVGIWLALGAGMVFAHSNESTPTNSGTGTATADAWPHTYHMMGFNMMDWGAASPGWMIFSWLMMIIWWAVIIGAVVLIVRALMRSANGGTDKSALDILKERYAKGEIDKKEFEEKKKEIEK